jgi:hypothetical protein
MGGPRLVFETWEPQPSPRNLEPEPRSQKPDLGHPPGPNMHGFKVTGYVFAPPRLHRGTRILSPYLRRLEKTLARLANERGLTRERPGRRFFFLVLCGVLERAKRKQLVKNFRCS